MFENRILRSAWRRRAAFLALGIVAAIAVYALAMTVALPRLVERALARYVAGGPERHAAVERMQVNPFTLTVGLTTINARDDRARISLAAPAATLNLGLRSFLESRPVLQSLEIEQPLLEIESRAFIDQLGTALADVRIARLDLRGGQIDFLDRNGAAERRIGLRGITLRASGLEARPGAASTAGRFTLSAIDASGSEIDVEGSLAAGLGATSGLFTLTDVDLETWRPWLGARPAALMPRGTLALSGGYRITALLTEPALSVFEARADVEALQLVLAPDLLLSTARLVANIDATISPVVSSRIELADATFELDDVRTPLAMPLVFDEVAGTAGVGSARSGEVELELTGRLVGAGMARVTARAPVAPDGERALSVMLGDVSAAALSPYVTASLGRELSAGRADLELDYLERGRRIEGTFRITARELAFEEADVATRITSDASPLELAAALLADPQRTIALDLPFTAITNSRGIRSILSGALRTRIAQLTAMPFVELGALVGRERDTLRAVPFEPGAAGLESRAQETLDALAAVLRERPGLGLRVLGGFDAVADRYALARQQIELHVQLASSDPSPQARRQPVDFASPRSQDVLDEFAGERLAAAERAAIAARFDCTDPGDALCRTAYYAAVFDSLVANETITDATLSRLGRFRAQSVAEALVGRGFAADRISVGTGATVTIAGAVSLQVEVQVYPQAPL